MPSDEPYITNIAKQQLKEDKPLFVFQVWELTRPVAAKISAQAGFHMIAVESEHELHNEKTLTDFIVTANDNGLAVMVSAPTIERHFISRILDAGALAIMLPHAETPEQVEQLAGWMKYPPVGGRAVSFGPNSDFQIPDVARYCEQANDATMIILKIESAKGIQNAEAMMSTGWVDGIVFGQVDLTVDWGVPGQLDHPEIAAAVDNVSKMAMSRGIAVAGSASDRASYERERARGAQIFFLPSELDIIRKAAFEFMDMVRS